MQILVPCYALLGSKGLTGWQKRWNHQAAIPSKILHDLRWSLTHKWGYFKMAGWFHGKSEIPWKNGWWLGVAPWLRKSLFLKKQRHLPESAPTFSARPIATTCIGKAAKVSSGSVNWWEITSNNPMSILRICPKWGIPQVVSNSGKMKMSYDSYEIFRPIHHVGLRDS